MVAKGSATDPSASASGGAPSGNILEPFDGLGSFDVDRFGDGSVETMHVVQGCELPSSAGISVRNVTAPQPPHRVSWRRCLVWGLVLGTALVGAGDLSAQVQMTDVSGAAGLTGTTYISSTDHSLGINWIDVDNDGWPDLFLVGGNPARPLHLYLNQGNGTFAAADALLPSFPDYETSGSVFADYDNDGDLDIFVYTDHSTWDNDPENNPKDGPPNLLLRNRWMENGQRLIDGETLFEDVAAAAGLQMLADPPLGPDYGGHRSKTAGWADVDRDGCVDLYVGQWVMNSGGDPSNRDRLFRNRCDGTFEDVTAAAGIDDGSDPEAFRAALAFLAGHVDDDLWPDLYVVNAGGGAESQPYINDFLFRNLGDGTFAEATASQPGIGDDAQAGMGIDVADIDLDGDWDLYISDLRSTTNDALPKGNVLYLGNGDGTFADNSAPQAGVQGENSWGVNFFDADHDGYEDLYVSTMNGASGELAEMFFINQGDGTFSNVGVTLGMTTGNARGSAVADYDGDGDLDLAVVNQGGGLQLFRNETASSGHWLQIQLRGAPRNVDAIGTVVEATVDGVTRRRQVKGGSSAHSQDHLVVHFGLGEATAVDSLRVLWPSGSILELTDVAVDQRLRLGEGLMFMDGFESGNALEWDAQVP